MGLKKKKIYDVDVPVLDWGGAAKISVMIIVVIIVLVLLSCLAFSLLLP